MARLIKFCSKCERRYFKGFYDHICDLRKGKKLTAYQQHLNWKERMKYMTRDEIHQKMDVNSGHFNHVLSTTGSLPHKCYRCRLLWALEIIDRRELGKHTNE